MMKMMIMIMTIMVKIKMMIFSLIKYIFGIGVVSLFLCGIFWAVQNGIRFTDCNKAEREVNANSGTKFRLHV